jgi:membrane protein
MSDVRDPNRRAARAELLQRVVDVVGSSTLRRVYARYGAAGGPLLASGLAYNALFAIVPAVVLAIGVSSLLLGSGADRAFFVGIAGRAFPPLLELLGPVTSELENLSASITILGLLGFAWGASRFTIALEGAVALVVRGEGRRGALQRQLLGVASVLLLVAAVIALAILAGLASIVEGATNGPAGRLFSPVVSVALSLAGPALGVVGLAAVYRYVPPGQPTWRDVLVPAAVVGVVLAIATRLFVVIAPRLVGAAAVFGSLAAVFIALAWFGATFQALLVGAAWVGDRAERRRSARSGAQTSS